MSGSSGSSEAGVFRGQRCGSSAPGRRGERVGAPTLGGRFFFLLPNSKLRSLVVPKPPAPAVEEGVPADKPPVRPSASPYRLDWAVALRRVFGVDILACARCGGRLTVLAFIEKLSAVRAILDHLGLPSEPLPLGKARGPPQVAWGF